MTRFCNSLNFAKVYFFTAPFTNVHYQTLQWIKSFHFLDQTIIKSNNKMI